MTRVGALLERIDIGLNRVARSLVLSVLIRYTKYDESSGVFGAVFVAAVCCLSYRQVLVAESKASVVRHDDRVEEADIDQVTQFISHDSHFAFDVDRSISTAYLVKINDIKGGS